MLMLSRQQLFTDGRAIPIRHVSGIWPAFASGLPTPIVRGRRANRSSTVLSANPLRALKFYTEKLGFELSTDQPFDDKQRWIELRISNSQTRVVLFTPEGHESRIGSFFNGSLA